MDKKGAHLLFVFLLIAILLILVVIAAVYYNSNGHTVQISVFCICGLVIIVMLLGLVPVMKITG